jgi:hypothetical protein
VPNFFVAARRIENMIKVTDSNELENLAEFYIFSEARRLAATKTSGQLNSILVGCRFKNEKSFSDSNDEFVKNLFSKKSILLNELSVK